MYFLVDILFINAKEHRIDKKKGKWILCISAYFVLASLFYSTKQQFYLVLFTQNDHHNFILLNINRRKETALKAINYIKK
jgi:hypothetical protein